MSTGYHPAHDPRLQTTVRERAFLATKVRFDADGTAHVDRMYRAAKKVRDEWLAASLDERVGMDDPS